MKPASSHTSYRLMAVLPAWSKVLEKLLLAQLSYYLEDKLPSCQFWFHPGHSSTAVVATACWAKPNGIGMHVLIRRGYYDATDRPQSGSIGSINKKLVLFYHCNGTCKNDAKTHNPRYDAFNKHILSDKPVKTGTKEHCQDVQTVLTSSQVQQLSTHLHAILNADAFNKHILSDKPVKTGTKEHCQDVQTVLTSSQVQQLSTHLHAILNAGI